MANRRGSGRGGRKPKPVSLKIAEGVRQDRVPVGALEVASGTPVPPCTLTPYELEGWTLFLEDVQRLRLLNPTDRHNAYLYAGAWGRARAARDEINARGLLIDSPHGTKPNPAINILAVAERFMASTLATYGLNPSDRSKLRATEQPAADRLEEIDREFA